MRAPRDKDSKALQRAVVDAGGIPDRSAKHGTFYRLPNGQRYLCNSSLSGPHGLKNAIASLNKALGMQPHG